MSNRLNFSSLDDAWGLPDDSNSNISNDQPVAKFNYKKPKENLMTIDSNEIRKPMSQEFKPVQETYTDYIKPCALVDEHIKNCEICRNKLKHTNHNHTHVNTNNNNMEHMTANIAGKYLDKTREMYDNFDLNESFENISPSQKNLVIVILYGILIILISDLIIKEEN
jgi:hypothetical protein